MNNEYKKWQISCLAILDIIVLLVGGRISFLWLIVYPEKYVNGKINGECYEFMDNAYTKHRKL
jgi:hypothetical protein